MLVLALAGQLLVPCAIAAQGSTRDKPPQIRLESIKHLKCVFTVGTVATWMRIEPQARTVTGPDLLTLEISEIDLTDASATVRRGSDRTSVSVRSDRSNLYLFRIDGDGNAQATTVFSQETQTGHLKSVHSEGGTGARQLYGDCTILE